MLREIMLLLLVAALLLAAEGMLSHRAAAPQMQVGMTGGDLEGGMDPARNADVRALKKLFYSDETTGAENGSSDADAALGLLRNIPVARFKMPVLMPGQQAAFNIFQPQLVHLFESLMATEKPWIYLHTHLPGGAENLGNPLYALPGLGMCEEGDDCDAPGPQALLHGTLMQVVVADRQEDARIALVSQGLGKAFVVRGTQALPYSRADVQMLFDMESLRAAARLNLGRFARNNDSVNQTAASSTSLRRLTLASAVQEEKDWRDYECKPIELDRPGRLQAFVTFNENAFDECKQRSDVPAQLAGDHSAFTECGPLWAALSDVMDSTVGLPNEFLTAGQAESGMIADKNEDAGTLASAEAYLWVQLDALLRAISRKQGAPVQAPVHLLGLLPTPPPTGSWPDEFVLSKAADKIFASDARDVGYVQCSKAYSARRRAQRLSFLVWPFLTDEQEELQAALQATSTVSRLRMAALHMKETREKYLGM